MSVSTQIAQGGRVVIPATFRQKMNIQVGDEILLTWDDELSELRLSTRKQRLQHARDIIKKYAKSNVSIVDALIADRRQAALDE